ncbi:hypothetical protein [Allopontixanthobacter sp.]|uniref:hypothetical protein n=1 Tax=Allopontixanthobacter sp. TaxID=2906452 RepID=UPI002AB92754|nr:hypothetical protein [Allopontixanthobacter sp.]MDZ4308765.1 hypothetical protein [Allopontixanthobacter sp.]
MNPTEILFLAGVAAAAAVMLYLALSRDLRGSATAAALLGGGFLGFTAVTVWAEGPIGFFTNHTANLWGVQVWYDLIFAVAIALFLLIPRARAVGMRVWPWIVGAALTASIALLPMLARVLWLERRKAAGHLRDPAPQ